MTKLYRIVQWDFFIPLGVFFAVSAWLLMWMLDVCGQVVYPLDDPYIHAAMARHWVQEGTFGVSLYGYSASSSSPLWTALLAMCFFVFGINEWIPLALNIMASSLLICVIHRLICEWISSRVLVCAIILFIIAALPLITQSFTGMEHPLHITLTVLLCQFILKPQNQRRGSVLCLLAALAVLTRYESLFVVLPLCLILWVNGEWKRLAGMLLGVLIPVVMLGCINIAMGWYFFPNSIIVKSAISTPEASWLYGVLIRLYHQLFSTTHLTVLFLLATPALLKKLCSEDGLRNEQAGWLFVFAVSAILHCAFASMGWFFRYEGYILALGFLGLFSVLGEWIQTPNLHNHTWKQSLIKASLFTVLVLIFISPYQSNILSIQKIVPGAKNIYEQQYQMGLFLRQYYTNETVLANDIGAINFLADIYCLDVMGLGSMEPLKAAQQGRFSPEYINTWSRLKGANIAVMYAGWWQGNIPESWKLAGTWTVKEKVTVSEQTISFFALEPSAFEPLALNLIAFQPELPDDVTVAIHYP